MEAPRQNQHNSLTNEKNSPYCLQKQPHNHKREPTTTSHNNDNLFILLLFIGKILVGTTYITEGRSQPSVTGRLLKEGAINLHSCTRLPITSKTNNRTRWK